MTLSAASAHQQLISLNTQPELYIILVYNGFLVRFWHFDATDGTLTSKTSYCLQNL